MTLWQTVRAGLVMPLAIVVVLGVGLGYVAGRRVYGDQTPARVSTITTRGSVAPIATLTPETTPGATETPGTQTGGRTGRDPRCPAGCECKFPAGGVQIICRGNRD
jgi:hypothetical protein